MMNDDLHSRRRFLRFSSLGLAAIAAACGSKQSNPGAASPDPDAAPPTDTGTVTRDSEADAAVDATPECLDTDDNIEGPFFKPSSPERADLVEPGMTGTRIVIKGRVLGEGCGIVLSGAVLDFWQADDSGAYFPVKLRGHSSAGADGSYSLRTIIPGHYLNGSQYRPAHIHVKVAAPGYALLTTQLYIEGDPYNAIDPFIKPRLIMKLSDLPTGEKGARFDFVIKKTR